MRQISLRSQVRSTAWSFAISARPREKRRQIGEMSGRIRKSFRHSFRSRSQVKKSCLARAFDFAPRQSRRLEVKDDSFAYVWKHAASARGSALITVVFTLLIVAVITGSLITQTRTDLILSRNSRARS